MGIKNSRLSVARGQKIIFVAVMHSRRITVPHTLAIPRITLVKMDLRNGVYTVGILWILYVMRKICVLRYKHWVGGQTENFSPSLTI